MDFCEDLYDIIPKRQLLLNIFIGLVSDTELMIKPPSFRSEPSPESACASATRAAADNTAAHCAASCRAAATGAAGSATNDPAAAYNTANR